MDLARAMMTTIVADFSFCVEIGGRRAARACGEEVCGRSEGEECTTEGDAANVCHIALLQSAWVIRRETSVTRS